MGAPDRADAVSPDSSFGGDGIVTTAFGGAGDPDGAYAMAIQPDGKLVLVGDHLGDFAVARYNPDGSLDGSFDGDAGMPTAFPGNGLVTTDVSGGSPDRAYAVALEADGDIVVAGAQDTLAINSPLGGDFAVVRYKGSDGSLDTSFDSDGIVITPFTFDSTAHGVGIQADGKIVASGWASVFAGTAFAVARYETDGTLDSGFDPVGMDGTVTSSFCSGDCHDHAYSMLIQGDGRIALAGDAEPDSAGTFDRHFGLARYTTTGALDSSFGGDGLVTTMFSLGFPAVVANALTVQPDGKLVAAGEDIGKFALARYTTGGAPDPSFSGDGKLTINASPIGNTSVAHGVALQGDGKIVAAGRAADDHGGQLHHDFALVRLTPSGALDSGFGCSGEFTLSAAPDPQVDIARAVAVLPDGKLVVAGYADVGPPAYEDYDFAVARLLPETATNCAAAPGGGASGPRCRGVAATHVGTGAGELIRGTGGRDVVVARGGRDRIFTGGGNDLVCAQGGNDRVFAGAGADRVFGDAGGDRLIGGAGRDRLFGGGGRDALRGLGGRPDRCFGGAGRDRRRAPGCEIRRSIP